MEARDFEAIDQFLSLVSKPDLFDYYGLSGEEGEGFIDDAIRKRRSWAQGQQSNPKYRHEALWLIKNVPLVRRALVDERGLYADEVRRKAAGRNRDKLMLFINGVLLDGELSPAKEAAIREQGRALDLSDDLVEELLDESRRGRETRRPSVEAPPGAGFRDYYELLAVPADASTEELEESYRARYRWARSLSDTNLSSEVYAQLDEAWRILKDEARRQQYDAGRLDFMQKLEQHAAGADGDFKGFLPPPPKRKSDLSGQHSLAPVAVDPFPQGDSVASAEMDVSVVVLTQDARVVHAEPPVQKNAPPPPRPGSSGRTIPPIPQGGAATTSQSPTEPPRPAAAPAPPDGIHTVPASGPFQPSRAKRSPKLEIDGPETHRIRVGSGPVAVRITVRNAGHGQMSGRVHSDREWVQLAPSRLDPLKRDQVIVAQILPNAMPKRQATSLITVVAEHGERRSITLDVERRAISTGVLLAAVAVAAMVLALVVVTLWF